MTRVCSYSWRAPFRQMERAFGAMPAVDVTEIDGGFEVTAELPGMDEKNVEVKLANHTLTIKGEKRDEQEETKKDYYMREQGRAHSHSAQNCGGKEDGKEDYDQSRLTRRDDILVRAPLVSGSRPGRGARH